jgi:hypothetical protein
MKLSPLRLAARLLACVAAYMATAATAPAHEFKLDAVINAFVKIEPGEAQFVVRAPLYLFKAARIPIKNAEIDVDHYAAALERSIGLIEQSLTLTENGKPLATSGGVARLSLPSDRSFTSYENAQAHVVQPLEQDTRIYVDQGYVDARITYPIGSPDSEFAIRTTAGPELGESLKLAVRYLPLNGESRSMVVTSLSGTVALNPTWWRAAATFTGLGVAHILTGYDHLLFLLCLVIPLRGWRKILSVVTVFTIAHSFTLLGTAFDLAPSGTWFPPFVETAIAASIVYMALENIMGVSLERRILITGLFGLVHGFGFSYGLQENFQFDRHASARLALRLQRRNRARANPGSRLHAAGSRSRAPLPASRPGGNDHSFGDRRRHRLALDARPCGRAVGDTLAKTDVRRRCDSRRLDRRYPVGRRRYRNDRQAAENRRGSSNACTRKGARRLGSATRRCCRTIPTARA